jgi:hypothetical protein
VGGSETIQCKWMCLSESFKALHCIEPYPSLTGAGGWAEADSAQAVVEEVQQYLQSSNSLVPITIRCVELDSEKILAAEAIFAEAGVAAEFFTFFPLGDDIFTDPSVNRLSRVKLPNGQTGIWKPFTPSQSQKLERCWRQWEASGKTEKVTMEMDHGMGNVSTVGNEV